MQTTPQTPTSPRRLSGGYRRAYLWVLVLWTPATIIWIALWWVSHARPDALIVYLQIEAALVSAVLLFAEARHQRRPVLAGLAVLFALFWLVDGAFTLATPLHRYSLLVEKSGTEAVD